MADQVQQARKRVSGKSTQRQSVPREPKQPARSHSVKVGRSGYSTYQGSSGQSDTSLHFPNLASGGKKGKVTTLMAEWLLAMLLIGISVFDGSKNYVDAMHDAIWRWIAMSALFFVMALVMRGPGSSRVATAFGGIIDLALILNLEQTRNTFTSLTGIFSGEGNKGTIQTASDVTSQNIGTTRPSYTDDSQTVAGNV